MVLNKNFSTVRINHHNFRTSNIRGIILDTQVYWEPTENIHNKSPLTCYQKQKSEIQPNHFKETKNTYTDTPKNS